MKPKIDSTHCADCGIKLTGISWVRERRVGRKKVRRIVCGQCGRKEKGNDG